MRPRTFVLLALAAVIATLAAVTTHWRGNQWSHGSVTGAPLLPALASGRASVEGLAVRQGDRTITLESRDGRWMIKERNYPADADRVRALIVKLAQSELIEAKTARADRHALLEVEDPAAPGAKSRTLRLTDGKGRVIADMIIGKSRWDAFGTGRAGTYLRDHDDKQVWLVSGDLDVSANVRSWINPVIVDFPHAKIVRLAIEVPGEEPLRIERGSDAEAKAAFVGLPEGAKLKDGGAVEAILRAAAAIDADDVRPAAASAGVEPAGRITYATRDGTEVTYVIRRDGDAAWIAIDATGTGDGKAVAEAIMQRARGFEFKVLGSKADALLKRRADLLQSS